ncbi:MAG TPA: 30S ribosomal protein S7 [Anaerolineae bacterium]|nr:30S ribosomal protein S7 [Anaerolineae bacterium]
MPRDGAVPRRRTIPDPKYGKVSVAQFINKLMERGKKSTAQRIFYDSCAIIEERTQKNPIETFETALRNSMPVIEVKPRRVGGATYQVPVEVPEYRSTALAIRWLIASAHSRSGNTMAQKLADELMDAAKGLGNTIKKREDTHKMAEANRAFAHYRW